MSNRKLQGEIDRMLKKIQEGIEEFDATWNKVQQASTPNLKEKYEGDLKKEIKKLQKMRDQVKTWAQSSEVKNKKPLLDAKKAIETEMERFKVLEREIKTKAYSKEGLSQSMKQKKDPTKDPNYPFYQWIEEMAEAITDKKEEVETALEDLRLSSKSVKKHQSEIEVLNQKTERFIWHLDQLENLEVMLREGEVANVRMEEIKDDVEYFMESMDDPDYYFDENMYEVLVEDNPKSDDYQPRGEDIEREGEVDVDVPEVLKKKQKKKKKQKEEDEDEEEKEGDQEESVTKVKSPTAKTKKVDRERKEKEEQQRKEKAAKKKAEKQSEKEKKAGKTKQSKTSTTPPPAPASPELSPRTGSAGEGVEFPTIGEALRMKAQPGVPTPVQVLPPKRGGPSLASMLAKNEELRKQPQSPQPQQQQQQQQTSPQQLPQQQQRQSQAPYANSTRPGSQTSPTQGETGHRQLQPQQLSAQEQQLQQSTSGQVSSQQQLSPQHQPPSQQSLRDLTTAPPGSLAAASASASAALAMRKEAVDLEQDADMEELNYKLKLMLPSRHHLPLPSDTARQSQYVPRNPYRTPPSFPSTVAPVFDDPLIFERFSTDTLFFIFYFQQGTQHQYLAARELKKQSWRYHKDFLTWFQRHDDPQLTTEEFEKGTYLFFDYKQSWQHAIKHDFTFHYRHLEDELMNNYPE